MPIIKSAKKKLRQDVKRTAVNLLVRNTVKQKVKNYRKTPTVQSLKEVFKAVDTAAKKNVFHANKASRLKSRLSKLLVTK
ncbi:hypothetical protein A3D77_03760 [Candidatus Gottesmanbacteria bacterium RIFCSPHIGHO2_02_FULL_39_11]|uniref:Small ribosomal subunit protein bS20 n=1 Tax=Candidatus Gottesmanbacteria bacterium RIFCSPHIGHO2_02_FULL_39_11 TaxID=1798382 RepID=A0A1F5ZXE2_9BACT|nr:MAG: hypothetical protein A3D77_03760 [Candidatus Gottesmanbacteria bacterium RIFCSPHIGHO2_02_FULL_39_11]